MVFDLKTLIEKHQINNVTGILHIGAHYGEEIGEYRKIWPNVKIQVFEPSIENFKILKKNCIQYSDIVYHNYALGDTQSYMKLYVETNNNGQSNSLLKPKIHTKQYPHIIFNDVISVEVKTLDSLSVDPSFNFIAIDVQGFELSVFNGAINTLNHVDYIMTEVNNVELYENCCLIEDLDTFLNKLSFRRVDTNWIGGTWGDALYIKQK
jgi:FkbM family methyltransferase